jgi:hypothetical protein
MLVLAGLQVASVRASPNDPFTGAWRGTGGPGSTLKIQIGGANAAGERHVTYTEHGGENAPPGAFCVAHGTGRVESNPSSGYDILTGTWTMRCPWGVADLGFGLIRPYSIDSMIYGSDGLRRASEH